MKTKSMNGLLHISLLLIPMLALPKCQILKRIPDNSNLDVLDMDGKLLKLSHFVLVPYIAKLINISVANGKFPTDLKLARVTPIYKNKGSTSNCSNYRPISCTAHIAKVMERVMQEQLKTYLYEHNFIMDDQSTYRPNHLTETSLK